LCKLEIGRAGYFQFGKDAEVDYKLSGQALSLACGTTVRSRVSRRGSDMKTSAKDEVRALLEKLPDDASLNDIQYHIYVRQKIERGLEAIRKGNVIPKEEIEKRMARWLER
jgi:hypothetical protein